MTEESKKRDHLGQLLNTAITLALKRHRGQFRRDGKTPYYNHVREVQSLVRKRNGSLEQQIVACLHDIVEDTETTFEELYSMFGEEITEAVRALTKIKGESYEDAILRAKNNKLARLVKICDNIANLSDNPTDKQIIKYSKSLQTLMEE